MPTPFTGDLTGTWTCDDSGTYYIRQVSNTIWWMGLAQTTTGAKPQWSNVYNGTLDSNARTITGNFADVPLGTNLGNGPVNLLITETTPLKLTKQSGGMIATTWTKSS